MAHPWDAPAATPTPVTCYVCGEPVGRGAVIVAQPHHYHRGC